jgi:hypothetical protein
VSATTKKMQAKVESLRKKADTTGWGIEMEQASEEALRRAHGGRVLEMGDAHPHEEDPRPFKLSAAVRAVLLHRFSCTKRSFN